MYFLVNLAVSGLVTGFVTMPSSVIIHVVELVLPADDHIDPLMHFMRTTYFVSATGVLLGLIMLSIDRYLAVVKPFQYRRRTGPKLRVLASILIWLMSMLSPTIYFLTSYNASLMVFANACVAVVLCTLAFTYFKVYRSIKLQADMFDRSGGARYLARTRNRKDCLRKRDLRVTRAFLVILTVFATFYIPVIIIIYTLALHANCDCVVRHCLRDAQFILGLSFSAAMPFVCALHLYPFRKAAIKILGLRWFERLDKDNNAERPVPLSEGSSEQHNATVEAMLCNGLAVIAAIGNHSPKI